ncbi:hypothetical protein GCM10022243_37490 [Saccharothrix violaceirubra]
MCLDDGETTRRVGNATVSRGDSGKMSRDRVVGAAVRDGTTYNGPVPNRKRARPKAMSVFVAPDGPSRACDVKPGSTVGARCRLPGA